MKAEHKAWIETEIKKLPFVNWDRFVENNCFIEIYGWINREDSHEDFVSLRFFKKNKGLEFISSSAKYDKQINEILGFKINSIPCQRVENNFKIDNCVRL